MLTAWAPQARTGSSTPLTRFCPDATGCVKLLPSWQSSRPVLYTLRYAVTRLEVWRWYWRAWARPAGLWRTHLGLGVSAAAGASVVQGWARMDWLFIVVDVTVCTAVLMVLLPLWPQLKFKSQVRTLEVDERGYRTVIGGRTGERTWSEIQSVQDDGETVILTTRQGNAILVPRRAFAGVVDRGQFVADIRRWHARG